MVKTYDVIIIGGGIVGLTLAQQIAQKGIARIALFEKEARVGEHASGRNSGVVHAGIYYPESSMKAKYCVLGHRKLLEFVETENLPVLKCGKVIVATADENLPTLDLLEKRGQAVGAKLSRISREELREIEPLAGGIGPALWSPATAVVNSQAILTRLKEQLIQSRVDLYLNDSYISVDLKSKTIQTTSGAYQYSYLVNTSGTQADQIAHQFGVGQEYKILPFKGLYFQAEASQRTRARRLIYPAPDTRMPFLGVHVTLTVDGKVLFGPTAIPAFGRENYGLLQGLKLSESFGIGWTLTKMLIRNDSGFRNYVQQEVKRYRPQHFLTEARRLMPGLLDNDIGNLYKVGIRAQLVNTTTQQLEMDFVIRDGESSLHILNAVSPAFTSAFGFSSDVADLVILGMNKQ